MQNRKQLNNRHLLFANIFSLQFLSGNRRFFEKFKYLRLNQRVVWVQQFWKQETRGSFWLCC
jgi:hypothetical protein